MQLSALLKDIFVISPQVDRDVLQLIVDSRYATPASLFIALKGASLDGRQFIPEAISRGATAVLLDAEARGDSIAFQEQIPIIPIHHLQYQLGLLASRFFKNPAKQLTMIGVTGTNGKTSCSQFIAQALDALHIPCGVIGTLGSGFYGALGEPGLTTPDAIKLQQTLSQFVDQGARAVAMEVSSHSIDQGRINAIPFKIGIFTNLTQDHLDYHGDMQTYAAVKHRFIADPALDQVIINADDDYGIKWINELSGQKSVYAYSIHSGVSVPDSVRVIYTDQVHYSLQGIRARVYSPWGEGDLLLPLIGPFNLSNALASLAALCVYGIPFEKALSQLSKLNAVPGRMQTLGGHNRPLAVVDYAHTPDALEKVLKALRTHTQGKLICVFGCGGDRDPGKRPLMAKIAEELADQVIVTNDNPRHENPEDIAAQICQGFLRPNQVSIELDRSKAIQNSIQWATVHDCVLIAGKGAEHYQQIGDQKIPFDDVEQVSSWLGI